MYGDCVEIINAALAQLGEGPIAVSRFTTGTPTAPNGGTASNANDGSLSTVVTTTTQIGVLNPYVVAQIDLGALKRLAYVDVYKLALSAGTSRGEFMLQHSIDALMWEQSAEAFNVTTDVNNHRRVNFGGIEVRYLRVARVGAVDLTTATATLAGIDVYPFGTNDKDVTVATLYASIRNAILTMHPWRETLRKSALTASAAADAPLTEWTQAFELPSYMLAGPKALFSSVSDSQPYKEWELYHGRLYTDITAAWIDYQVRVEESDWPPYLRQLIVYAAGAEFAEPITDQTSKAQTMMEKAFGPPGADGKGGYFRAARNLESQNKTSEAIRDFSLIEVRG